MSTKMISSGDFDDWFSQLWQQKSSSFNSTEEIQFIILAATWRGPSHKFTAFLAGAGKKMNFVTETRVPSNLERSGKHTCGPCAPCAWQVRANFMQAVGVGGGEEPISFSHATATWLCLENASNFKINKSALSKVLYLSKEKCALSIPHYKLVHLTLTV
jgi:hypothetical protein